MLNSLFITSQGSSIFSTLGALDEITSKIDNVTNWNVCGNASLILFFKCLGYTFKQTFDTIKELPLIVNFLNGANLMPENEEDKLIFLEEWLEEKIEEKQIFNKDVTLREIYDLTKISPCFIVWSRNRKKLFNISQKNVPKFKLIDAVMASCASLGLYSEFNTDKVIFSNPLIIDCFPYIYSIIEENSKFLYIANISRYNKNYKNNNLGPLKTSEDELLLQLAEHNEFRINNISKTIKEEEILKIYSILLRGNVSYEEKLSLFVSGKRQAKAFLLGEDTEEEEENYKKNIYSQS